MHKMCPRCGVVFEVKSDAVFCSDKCRTLFQSSSLDVLKGRSSGGYLQHLAGGRARPPLAGDANTDIIRPRKQKQ